MSAVGERSRLTPLASREGAEPRHSWRWGGARPPLGYLPHPGAMMNFHTQHRYRAVTLSAAKGLSRWAQRCFAALRVTGSTLNIKIQHRAATLSSRSVILTPLGSRAAATPI